MMCTDNLYLNAIYFVNCQAQSPNPKIQGCGLEDLENLENLEEKSFKTLSKTLQQSQGP